METNRLEIIEPKWDYFDLLYDECFKDIKVMKYLLGNTLSYQEAKKFYEKQFIEKNRFEILREKESKEIVGYGGIDKFNYKKLDGYELGYILSTKYWGNGFATEIAKAQLESIFLNGYKVFATVHPLNISSQKVLEKIGMRSILNSVNFPKRGLRNIYEFPKQKRTTRI